MNDRVDTDLSEALDGLTSNKDAWVRSPLRDRLRLLADLHLRMRRELPGFTGEPAALIARAQMLAGDVEALIETLSLLDTSGAPPPVPVRRTASGLRVADIYPRPWQPMDAKGALAGFRAELHLRGGSTQGARFETRRRAGVGRVAKVLGTRDADLPGILEALHLLFIEQHVVLLVHDAERAADREAWSGFLEPLTSAGILRSVVGPVDRRIDRQHRAGALLGDPPPWIVAPARHEPETLRHQATHLAAVCASANGAPPTYLILGETWAQRDGFLEAYEEARARFGGDVALEVQAVPDATADTFWAAAIQRAHEVPSLTACTVVVPDDEVESVTVQSALAELRTGLIGVNVWAGTAATFEMGLDLTRNALLFDDADKAVLFAPLTSPAHLGMATTPTPEDAERRVAWILGDIDTSRKNEGNPICAGNFRPLAAEGAHGPLEVRGQIPAALEGMYVRNGTNQRLPPTGKMHMFDGDAMLHCVRFAHGRVEAYANSWVKTPRFVANARTGRDPYPTFGDLAMGGPEVLHKLRSIQAQTKSGAIPSLGLARPAHPSTSTARIGDRIFAVSEVVRPFEIFIDPVTGVVTSGDWEDFSGRLQEFSAHARVCPESGELHYVSAPNALAVPQGKSPPPDAAIYGVFDRRGELMHRLPLPMRRPLPQFLHDQFLTPRHLVLVDHSMRADRSTLATTGPFTFRKDMNLRFGVVPRRASSADAVRWFDLGKPGFVYHVVAGWEEGEPGARDHRMVLWLPIFDTYPSTMPIHLADEPPSYLRRVVLDLFAGEVIEDRRAPGLEETPGERCDVNRRFFGKRQRWAYLMRRAEGREMYDGFVKYDLFEERAHTVVDYGEHVLGGEALFVPKPGGAREDEGWLIDIVFDERDQRSQLCVWDAATLGPRDAEPIARVLLPHRVPFGVHGNFFTPDQLQAQAGP